MENLGNIVVDGLNLLTSINLGFYGGFIRPLDLCHGLAIALELKLSQVGVKNPWFHRFVTYILVAVGGGIVAGFTAGQHVPWLTDNGCIFTYFAVWLVINYCPGDIVTSIMIRQPFYFLFRLIDSFCWGHAITSWGVDYALAFHLNSFILRTSIGFISGSGGGLVTEMFSLKEENWVFQAPRQYLAFPFEVQLTLFLTVFYALLLQPVSELCSSTPLPLDHPLAFMNETLISEYVCMLDEPVKAIVILVLVPVYFMPKLEVKQVLKKHSGKKKRRQLLRERKRAREEAEKERERMEKEKKEKGEKEE